MSKMLSRLKSLMASARKVESWYHKLPPGMRPGAFQIIRKFRPVHFYAWRPEDGNVPIAVNFGDDLFPAIVSKILGRKLGLCPPSFLGRKFFIGGSTLQFANNGDLVWGAGIRDGTFNNAVSRLTVFAVRGPLTAEILRKRGVDVSNVYGDPAMLLPELLSISKDKEPIHDLGIVPHFSEICYPEKVIYPPHAKLISPAQDWLTVVQQLQKCRKIIASSLHGIICAEALGIPVVSYRRTQGDNIEPDFKYQDYFAGTGREWRPFDSIHAAMEADFKAPPSFSDQARALLESFPRHAILNEGRYSLLSEVR